MRSECGPGVLTSKENGFATAPQAQTGLNILQSASQLFRLTRFTGINHDPNEKNGK